MTSQEVTAPGQAYVPPGPDARELFDTAIRAVSELIMELGSANAEARFEAALQLRGDTGAALSRAADRLAGLADLERDEAVRKLVAMRRVANHQFLLAPNLSAAAIEGDRSALERERQAWIAERWANGSHSPRHPRQATQPEPVRVWTAMDASLVETPQVDEDGLQ